MYVWEVQKEFATKTYLHVQRDLKSKAPLAAPRGWNILYTPALRGG